MPLRAILFDHDGTLVDSEPEHFRMWKQVLARYGIALTEQQYIAHYAGVPNRTSAIDVVNRFGLDVDPAIISEAKSAVAREHLATGAYPLMSGALDAITEFRRAGLTLGVVTGASAHAVEATLRVHGLQQHFETVVSGDEVRANKPAPDCYLLALERLGLSAADCIAIEDTQHGLQAARGAGIRCLVLPTALSREHDFAGAEVVLDGLSQAVAHIRPLLAGR